VVQSITNSIIKCSNCGFTFNLNFPQRGFIWEFKKLNKFNVPCPKCNKKTLKDVGDAQFNGIYPVYDYNSISRSAEIAISAYIFAAIISAFVVLGMFYNSNNIAAYSVAIIILMVIVPIVIYVLASKNATISLQIS
jgi:hypothetical protein